MTNNYVNILNNFSDLSEDEKQLALSILKELESTGSSNKYNSLLYEDYKELPPTIEEFLHDPKYLGKALTNEDGKYTLFPYWEEVLKKIFPDRISTNYNTLILTGGIGLGKSTIADIAGAYILCRVLCLKNPYTHYGIQEIDKISFAFLNITLDAAEGVAWQKFQAMMQSSSWFLERGYLTKSKEPEWFPNGGIELLYGSKPSHILGRAVFYCLSADTIVSTTEGDFKISDLVDKEIKVYSIDSEGNKLISDTCTVKPTVETKQYYEITLENNETIKCTAEHRFMLKDGTYKEAQYLTEDDELFDLIPYGYIYKTTNLVNKIKIKKISKCCVDEAEVFYDVINANPYNNFLIKTGDQYICSHNCFVDEASFQPNKDLNQQIAKAKQIVNAAAIRMQSRFMKGEKNPTLLAIASSKRTEQSYLETLIADKKKNESKTTLIIDEPQWVIRTDKDSPHKFKVAVGNKFLESELLPLDADERMVNLYRDKGFSILEVPMGYYENFRDDLDQSLTDIAGMSVSLSSRFISGQRWAECKSELYRNPFTKDVITVGNARDDTVEYKDFFDLSAVDPKLKKFPLYIHLDMSVSGDKTGIGGVWLIGKRIRQNDHRSSDLYYQTCFSVSVKAPKGHQVSFKKNRNFIRWLKSQGFNIKGISSDTYQSYDLQQSLSAEGFNCSIISVDRCTDKICIPYQTFKTAIYENRLIVYNKCEQLTEEVIGLEKNNDSGAIDHSPAGINEKDQVDSICGALYNASQHGEEFAQDFGETYETIISVNNGNYQNDREQITIDFEEALKQIQDPLHLSNTDTQRTTNKDSRMDFGFGKSQKLPSVNISDGILFW